MTHYEWIQAHPETQIPVECAAWHMTFGDRCLNCGYDGLRDAESKAVKS